MNIKSNLMDEGMPNKNNKTEEYFTNTEPSISTHEFDKNKRKFLGLLGGLGVSSVVGSTIGFSPNAEALNMLHVLKNPGPGVMNCMDRQFAGVYRMGGTTIFSHDLLGAFMSPQNNHQIVLGTTLYKLDKNTPLIEPLYYFAAGTLMKQYDRMSVGPPYIMELPKINLALSYFDCLMESFGSSQGLLPNNIRTQYPNQEEELALKSICVAALGKNKGEQTAKEMLKANFNGKEVYAREIVESFSRMNGYDRKSKNPQNPFNQALVANWASYVITNHFENKFYEDNNGLEIISGKKHYEAIKFYHECLEKPLEQFAYRIRPDASKKESYHHMRLSLIHI